MDKIDILSWNLIKDRNSKEEKLRITNFQIKVQIL